MCEKSVISEKRGHFGTLQISVFIEIGEVLRLKSAILSTWRTLMGYTNFRRLGVLGFSDKVSILQMLLGYYVLVIYTLFRPEPK